MSVTASDELAAVLRHAAAECGDESKPGFFLLRAARFICDQQDYIDNLEQGRPATRSSAITVDRAMARLWFADLTFIRDHVSLTGESRPKINRMLGEITRVLGSSEIQPTQS